MSQVTILQLLNKERKSTFTANSIAKLTGITPSSTHMNLERLMNKGYVARVPLSNISSGYIITRKGQTLLTLRKAGKRRKK